MRTLCKSEAERGTECVWGQAPRRGTLECRTRAGNKDTEWRCTISRQLSPHPNEDIGKSGVNSRGVAPAVCLMVVAASSQQIGAAVAVTVWPVLGAAAIVFLRFAVATAVLVTARRPRLANLTRAHWLTAVGLAVAVAVMSLAFYNATGRIPLGIAVTIEVLGPLVLSVVTARRRVAMLWAVLAFGGIVLLGITSDSMRGSVNVVGIVCAAVAAVAWAVYIQLSARAAKMFDNLDALTLASFFGCLFVAPLAIVSGGLPALADWRVVGLVAAIALLSSVIPFTMEMTVLKSLSPTTFAVLSSLSPVLAAVVGLVMLGQYLTPWHYLAITMVTIAGVGAVRTGSNSDADRRRDNDDSSGTAPRVRVPPAVPARALGHDGAHR